jgi:hypothetical protein
MHLLEEENKTTGSNGCAYQYAESTAPSLISPLTQNNHARRPGLQNVIDGRIRMLHYHLMASLFPLIKFPFYWTMVNRSLNRNNIAVIATFLHQPPNVATAGRHLSADPAGYNLTRDSERAWLKVNVPALTAGNTQNLLTLRTNDNCRFRSATTTKNPVRSSADNMLTESNEKLDLFRWREICNWHSIDENPNCASRTHKTTVTLDDKAARVWCLR